MTPIVFTDLDATLLDEVTYRFDGARPALAALKSRAIPLVLASSKTRPEMLGVASALGIEPYLIVEDGGAAVWPPAGGDTGPERPPLNQIALGTPRPALVDALRAIAAETAATLTGFSALSIAEIARLTGLDEHQAALAADREWDEPFLIEPLAARADVEARAAARGLRVSRGGRFFHLTGGTDKGHAARSLLAALEAQGRHHAPRIALGDAPNDLSLLRMADVAVIVPRTGGPEPYLTTALPYARVAAAPGPAGWNEAVLALLDGPLGDRR